MQIDSIKKPALVSVSFWKQSFVQMSPEHSVGTRRKLNLRCIEEKALHICKKNYYRFISNVLSKEFRNCTGGGVYGGSF
jgi:hypothetical protein